MLSKNCSDTVTISQVLAELLALPQYDYEFVYKLSADPLSIDSFGKLRPASHHQEQLPLPQEPSRQRNETTEPSNSPQSQVGETSRQSPQSLIRNEPIRKTKRITKQSKQQPASKKARRTKNTRKKPSPALSEDEDLLMDEEEEISTQIPVSGKKATDTIRDQNNPKTYHKIVKKQLQLRNLGQQILKYEDRFANRYYFVIALILIKQHLNLDFRLRYAQLVQAELYLQRAKRQKKQQMIRKIERALKNLNKNSQEYQVKDKKKLRLEKQIEHLKVVEFEMSQFSVKSCEIFFQTGDIEKALQPLYQKGNSKIKKQKFYEEAVKEVLQIQTRVRNSLQS